MGGSTEMISDQIDRIKGGAGTCLTGLDSHSYLVKGV